MSVWTFSETQKLNRPYLSSIKRNDVLLFEKNGNYQVFETTIKNTGNLPAEFRTYLNGWPCTSTPRRSDSDYLAPGQEINVGYNLSGDCKLFPDNMCRTYEHMNLGIEYRSPGQKNFDYLTSFKMRVIPGTQDMINSTSTGEYSIVIIRCGGDDSRNNLVSVWYVEQMK